MALNFPNTPTNGQKYTDPNGTPWVYETATNSWTAGSTLTGGMVYKGGLDITAAPPTGAASGWTYSVTTGGTANAGFTGLTGNIPQGSQIIFDGSNWQQLSGSSAPASETLAGIVELATAAETTTGTDNTRAVHPAGLKVELNKKAPLASPALTGTPTAPTAAAGTNTTQLATTAFVYNATSGSNVWKRTGTVLTPATAGDTIKGQLLPTNGALGFRNVLINGEFIFWQRGTAAFSRGGAAIAYGSADRWGLVGGTSTTGEIANTGVPKGLVAGINLANNNTLGQRIEFAQRFASGSTWTLSVWSTGVPTFSLVDSAGTQHIPGGAAGVATGVASNGSTRYTYTHTFTADSAAAYLQFTISNNSGATITLTGAQMEEGPVATPFEHRPTALVLAMCRRFCGVYSVFVPTAAVPFVYNTKMRAAPTASIRNAPSGDAGFTTSGVLTPDMCYIGKTVAELCDLILDAEIK